MPENEIIELDDSEYLYLSEKFDIMSNNDAAKLPSYIVSSRREKLNKIIRAAIDNELEGLQKQYISEKFENQLNVSQIANKYNVSRQSVYRVINKAENRLFDVLKYVYYCGFSLINPPKNLDEVLRQISGDERNENNYC